MISLSLIILILFLLFQTGYWIGVFFLLYHLIRFGVGTMPKKFALTFLSGSILLLFLSAIGLAMSYRSFDAYGKSIGSYKIMSPITNQPI